MGRRRLRPIPGEPVVGSAEERVGEARGLTLGGFVPGAGAEWSVGRWRTGTRRRRPRELRLRRGEGAVVAKGCRANFGRCSWSRRRAQAVATTSGKWDSTAAVAMVWRHWHGRARWGGRPLNRRLAAP
jgi:hypothetical protein